MLWFFIAFVAYFLNALAAVVDKTMLKKESTVGTPVTYTFSIAMFGALLMIIFLSVSIFVPSLQIGFPGYYIFFISLVTGGVNIWALLLIFSALKKDDASRVSPMVGGLIPIFVLVLAWYMLGEKLETSQYVSFIFLILGTFLIALDFQEKGFVSWLKNKFHLKKKIKMPHIRKTIWLALPAAFLFAVMNVLTKHVYTQVNFVDGFLWTRLGAFVAVLFLLFSFKNREEIRQSFHHEKKSQRQKKNDKKTAGRFLVGQVSGGLGSLFLQYAIFLGSVTLVNALQGVQYGFVFLIVALLTLFAPKILKEKISREIVIQKLVAICLIGIGLFILVF
jgi:drug/metabolite transporter (DMT)-like permease